MRPDAKRLIMAGNRLVEAIQQGQRYAAICKRDRIVGINRERLLKACQPLGGALVLYAGSAAVDKSFDVVGLLRDHLVEARECFVKAIEIEQRGAAIDFDVGPSCGGKRRIVARQSLFMAAEFAKDNTTGIECVRLRRLLGKNFVAGSERFLEAIESQKRIGAIIQRSKMIDIDRECDLEFFQRLFS